MANNSDGSFHIYLEPKKKPKPIPKEILKEYKIEIPKVEKKEVKHDKQKGRK